MSANVYSIETLLVGTHYRSKTLSGEIVSAQKDDRCVWYQDCESYLVEIKPDFGFSTEWRTVAVRTENL